MERKRYSNFRTIVLSWLAFAGTFCLIVGIPIFWPSLRGAAKNDAEIAVVSMSGGAMITGVFVGLAVLEYVERRLGPGSEAVKRDLARSGCLFVVFPSAFVAFFCTCAPLGILAGAESSVRPVKNNWSNEIMIVAWIIGLLSAIRVAIAKRKARSENQVEQPPSEKTHVELKPK